MSKFDCRKEAEAWLNALGRNGVPDESVAALLERAASETRRETLERAVRVLAGRERIAESHAQLCSVRDVIRGCRRAVEHIDGSDAPIPPEAPSPTGGKR